MVGVVLAGGIAIFLAGLAVGMLLTNVFVLRHDGRRSRLIGKARARLRASRDRGLPARSASPEGQPDGGPWR